MQGNHLPPLLVLFIKHYYDDRKKNNSLSAPAFFHGSRDGSVISITKSITQSTCNHNDGVVSVSASGGLSPYTYKWRTNQGPVFSTSTSISALSPGLYFIKVTDANNDYQEDSVSIGNGITAYFSYTTNALCPLNNGTAEIMVIGGTAPISYAWSNGSTSRTATGLAGNATVQVEATDANGCKAYFYNYNVSPTPSTIGSLAIGLSSSLYVKDTTFAERCPLQDGSITIMPGGGTAPYSYYWHTTPVRTTQTITGLVAGSYQVTVTDANGCTTDWNSTVRKTSGTLNVTASKTNDQCSKLEGTATLSITGGSSPYTIQWPDGSNALSRTDLGYGNYSVNVTDQNNCVFLKSIFIDDISPVSLTITSTATSCDSSVASGTALAVPTGGTGPYTYTWSNGAATAAAGSIYNRYYSVLAQDANGCKAYATIYIEIDNNCYSTISGKIFQDNNGNCIQDAGDFPIMNSWVYMNGGSNSWPSYDGQAYTDATGNYTLRYSLPGAYTLVFSDDARTIVCPSAGNYEVTIPLAGVNYSGKDFAMQPKVLEEDVKILYGYILSEPRRGFDYTYTFSYQNIGTLPSDGFIEIVHTSQESYVSSSPAADSYNPTTRTLRFNYTNLMLGEIRPIQVTFNLSPSTLLGTMYVHPITADILGTDPTPANNTIDYNFTVVGSFDPNDLSVSPRATISESDTVLTYTIRFQNTGTYPAQFVIVKDTLDINLEISSIRDITSSHHFRYRVLENRAVEFLFDNINLPDSNRNEPGSHGFVSYSIYRKKNLSPGTAIRNKVEIYFDYNAPVVTNSTMNTMAQRLATGTTEKTVDTNGSIYPNPAKDYTEFHFAGEISSVQLMNSSGFMVRAQEINNQKEFRMELNLSKGLYFYTAYSKEGNVYSGNLIIE